MKRNAAMHKGQIIDRSRASGFVAPDIATDIALALAHADARLYIAGLPRISRMPIEFA